MQGQQVPVNLWSREWDGVGTLGRSLSMGVGGMEPGNYGDEGVHMVTSLVCGIRSTGL